MGLNELLKVLQLLDLISQIGRVVNTGSSLFCFYRCSTVTRTLVKLPLLVLKVGVLLEWICREFVSQVGLPKIFPFYFFFGSGITIARVTGSLLLIHLILLPRVGILLSVNKS